MTVIYDGQCPFCQSFVKLMALRDAVGRVDLVDARGEDPRIARLRNLGYDLDGGMAVLFGDAVYYGADAVALIAALTGARGPAGRLLARLLRDPRRAGRLYPWMKAGRRLVLRALGRPSITRPP